MGASGTHAELMIPEGLLRKLAELVLSLVSAVAVVALKAWKAAKHVIYHSVRGGFGWGVEGDPFECGTIRDTTLRNKIIVV